MAPLDSIRAAARAGDLDLLQALAAEHPSVVAAENPEGVPLPRLAKVIALHLALLDGETQTVERLLEEDSTLVAARWTRQCFTPASQAVVESRPALLQLLLARGADPRETYDGGTTLLHTAAFAGCRESARILIELGLDVNARDASGASPLAVARGCGQAKMVEWLVGIGATA